MLRIHPIVRLLCAAILVIAVFLSANLEVVAIIYMLVTVAVIATGVIGSHIRFVVFVTSPILLSLLLVWGWVMDSAKIPIPHANGVAYAVFSWLRIVACGGVLQALFLPLVQRPQYLRRFLDTTGLKGPVGTLLLASIVFLPEVKRRLAHVIDARRAQGHIVNGVQGLRQLPSLLMPLVSSLLDSASRRAELWTHRGLLDRYSSSPSEFAYERLQSATTVIMALTALAIGIWA